eukprot:1139240-Pelagomonas_calceolata.AAC.1
MHANKLVTTRRAIEDKNTPCSQVMEPGASNKSPGVKRATKNWAILRQCGHVPLQAYWCKSAINMYNGLLNSNCETLRKVLKEDLHLHSRAPSCWTAQVLDGFQGLWRCESFVTTMKQGTPISLQDFTGDLRHRLHGAWRAVEGVDP